MQLFHFSELSDASARRAIVAVINDDIAHLRNMLQQRKGKPLHDRINNKTLSIRVLNRRTKHVQRLKLSVEYAKTYILENQCSFSRDGALYKFTQKVFVV